MNCRACGNVLSHEFIDLGRSPASNSFLTREQLSVKEPEFPLKLFVCAKCFLVQVDEYKKSNEIFSKEYVYFSSYSKTLLAHARQYVEMITDNLSLTKESLVIELASNDGYLLQYFKHKGVPVLGIEPSKSVATAAREKGIETIIEFFGTRFAGKLAAQGRRADLIVANNVLAHVPDINDFVAGLKMALKPGGVVTAEFSHLMKIIEKNLFDTIYQEHYSYFSFHTVFGIFNKNGMKVFDAEALSTQGGSLRIWACDIDDKKRGLSSRAKKILEEESTAGMGSLEYYQGFDQKVNRVRDSLLGFLRKQKEAGKKIIAYGAAAKGNTLLNYCKIRQDIIDFVVDASKYKQGKFLPGSHIPVVSEENIKKVKPDYILILPWNLKEEITTQLDYVRQWGGQFIIPIPSLEVF